MPFPLQIIYSILPPRVYSLNLKVQALNIVELANGFKKKKKKASQAWNLLKLIDNAV